MTTNTKELIERLRGHPGYCPFCGHDPYHYVDNGIGMERVAVTCCDLGVALYQDGDELLVREVALRAEAATLLERQAEAAGKLVEALERVVSDCGLAYNSLGNSGPEFASVQRGFSIIEYRARQALREYHEAHHGN